MLSKGHAHSGVMSCAAVAFMAVLEGNSHASMNAMYRASFQRKRMRLSAPWYLAALSDGKNE